jgi:hypothetical protein
MIRSWTYFKAKNYRIITPRTFNDTNKRQAGSVDRGSLF